MKPPLPMSSPTGRMTGLAGLCLVAAALTVTPMSVSSGAGSRVGTRALIRAIAKGKVPPADLIDPQAGLIWVGYTSGDTDQATRKRSDRLCGKQAERALARLLPDLASAVDLDEIFYCSKDGLSCELGIRGEFGAQWKLEFRAGHQPPILEAVVVTNSTYKPKDEARVIALLRKEQEGTACTAK